MGHGIGTAGIAEALHRMFPAMCIGRVDRDTPTLPSEAVDILVASERFTTSLAPTFTRPVGLVAVLHAERFVRGDEYRTDELLVQAIRNLLVWAQTWDAEAIVQTSAPDRLLWSALPTNLAKFYRSDIEERTALGYPPATRYLRCDRIGADGERAGAALTHLIQSMKSAIVRSVDVPMTVRIGTKLRTTILVRIAADATDQAIASLTAMIPPEWSIDVDPTTLTP
jgi:primosomal protein N'